MCDKRRCSALCLGLWPHRMKFQTNNLEQILHWGRRTDGPTVWSTSAVQFVRSITSSLSRRRRRVVLPISEFHSSCRGNISCVKKHRNSDVTAKCNPKNATQVTVFQNIVSGGESRRYRGAALSRSQSPDTCRRRRRLEGGRINATEGEI